MKKYIPSKEDYLKRAKTGLKFLTNSESIMDKSLSARVVDIDPKARTIDFEITLIPGYVNAVGILHGGVTAWLADSFMAVGVSTFDCEYHGSTIDMHVNYINPLRCSRTVLLRTRCIRCGNFARRASCEFIDADGTVMVTCTGNYTGRKIGDDYTIALIDENTWCIEDGTVRYFVLNGKEKSLMIDTGVTGLRTKAAKECLTELPMELINTHADPDHIAGNKEFDSFMIGEKDIDLYCEKTGTSKENCNAVPVCGGQIIELGDRPVKVIEIPGHSFGGIALLDINERTLYAGDTVQSGDIFMTGSHRNMDLLIESYKKLIAMSSEFDTIRCSHAELDIETEILPKLLDAAVSIKEGSAGKGISCEVYGHKVIRYSFGFASFLLPDKN